VKPDAVQIRTGQSVFLKNRGRVWKHLNEVVASFDAENVASRKVLEKAGLVDRGMMRCYGEDGPNYRITRVDWHGLQQST
jgi:RimJ/RimL family protein N-acetyltransferase